MKNWIKNFINDERGAESAELAVSVLVVAAGAIASAKQLRDKIAEKQQDTIDSLDDTNNSGGTAP